MRLVRLACAVGALAVLAPTLSAQGHFPPDSLTNLKVFPKTIPVRQLLGAMRGISQALGVRCHFCHKGEEGQPLSSYDFASDAKRTKRTAREMLRMVAAINSDYLTKIPERPADTIAVRCATCHRGMPRPMLMNDFLARAYAGGGADSAVGAWRTAREHLYGRGMLDFTDRPLIAFAEQVLARGKPDDALAILTLAGEQYPDAPSVPVAMGDAYRVKGDTASAIAQYRRALQLQPNNRLASRRLRELGGQP